MNRPAPQALAALVVFAILAVPASASAQRGVIGVSAVVAPASTMVPPLANDLHELPGTVRDAIVRGRTGVGEAADANRERGRGGSSWIITVKSAPVAPAGPSPETPDRSAADRRPAVHVVTYTIAAAA